VSISRIKMGANCKARLQGWARWSSVNRAPLDNKTQRNNHI